MTVGGQRLKGAVNSPRVGPASPSPSLLGPAAALLAQRDASPTGRNTNTFVVVFFLPNMRISIIGGCCTHNSVNKSDELLFLLLPLDEVSLNQRLQL